MHVKCFFQAEIDIFLFNKKDSEKPVEKSLKIMLIYKFIVITLKTRIKHV